MKRELNLLLKMISALNGIAFLVTSCVYIFNVQPGGLVLAENSYLFLLLGIGLFQVYIVYPLSFKYSRHVLFLDIVCALAGLSISFYFALNGYRITAEGWMLMPPNDIVIWLAAVLIILVLESLRRVAGLILFILCTFFASFPLFASHLPPPFLGNSFSLPQTLTMHAIGTQSLLGIPMTVTGTLLIGYIIFGVVLKNTGGAEFFLDSSSALMGRRRGGAGKIAVLSSSLFGSISGSSISNVITTGSVTIPAMKRTGFKPHEAGAIEACASTGGMLMPPVMGAVAFLMAQFLGISYFSVVTAAIVPSLMFYTGLFIVLDARAARNGIEGLPRDEVPNGAQVLRRGWPYIATILLLVYFLYLRMESEAPFYAALMLFFVLIFRSKTTGKRIDDCIELLRDISISVSELIAMLAAVGFIIGAMSMTGVGTALSSELVNIAGNNRYFLLIMGAVASFILGMGLTASACYIFLAVVLAPSLVSFGFNLIAVHLFILYWAIISNITPPVALACFPAARLAETSYFRVGFHAVAFGFVCYIVPFAFVLDPGLVLQDTYLNNLVSVATGFIGLSIAAFGVARRSPVLGDMSVLVASVWVVTGAAILLTPNLAVELSIMVVFSLLFVGQLAAQRRLAVVR